jgi:hypothetical protein
MCRTPAIRAHQLNRGPDCNSHSNWPATSISHWQLLNKSHHYSPTLPDYTLLHPHSNSTIIQPERTSSTSSSIISVNETQLVCSRLGDCKAIIGGRHGNAVFVGSVYCCTHSTTDRPTLTSPCSFTSGDTTPGENYSCSNTIPYI